MGPAADAAAEVKTNHLVDSSNYLKVKDITLGTARKVAYVANDLRNEGSNTAYCKVEFTYDDGTDANSTQQGFSNSAFTTYFHANPSPEKTVTKVAVWLQSANGCLLYTSPSPRDRG